MVGSDSLNQPRFLDTPRRRNGTRIGRSPESPILGRTAWQVAPKLGTAAQQLLLPHLGCPGLAQHSRRHTSLETSQPHCLYWGTPCPRGHQQDRLARTQRKGLLRGSSLSSAHQSSLALGQPGRGAEACLELLVP